MLHAKYMHISSPTHVRACFGWGRESCLGVHLAESTMFIYVAMALATLDISRFVENGGIGAEGRVCGGEDTVRFQTRTCSGVYLPTTGLAAMSTAPGAGLRGPCLVWPVGDGLETRTGRVNIPRIFFSVARHFGEHVFFTRSLQYYLSSVRPFTVNAMNPGCVTLA